MARRSTPLPRWKKLLFGLMPTVGLVLAVAVVEMVMTATDRGIDTRPFAAVPGDDALLRDNLDFPFKYHPRTRASRQDLYRNLFGAEKAEGVMRGVVLGGSTAEGFPYYGVHGFGGVLQEALTAASDTPVEMLNLGFSAMSSYYVRDAARKLAAAQDQLQLDFAVLYTGHNEYYGTISWSSGSSHLAKLVNMRLKDRRVFQALYNLLGPEEAEGGPTLMTRQYARTRFPVDAERDVEVAARFVENVARAADLLRGAGIAVIVVEPVANLVDMPPFVAAGDPGVETRVVEAGRRVLAGADGAAEAWLADDSLAGRTDDALAVYVTARARRDRGLDATAGFLRAKDLDPAPFRARSSLVGALRDWAEGDGGVVWVPLAEDLTAAGGPAALSHDHFIDHLHFNHAGQVAVARSIARAMAGRGVGPRCDAAALDAWFADTGGVDASIGFLRIFDALASRRVADLVAGPPYSGMALGYDTPGSARGADADLMQDPELRRRLRQAAESDLLAIYSAHLLEGGHREAFLRFLNAFRSVNPGSPASHMAAGNFFATVRTERADAAALEAYRLALDLSDDPGRQRGVIKSYLTGRGRADLAGRLDR